MNFIKKKITEFSHWKQQKDENHQYTCSNDEGGPDAANTLGVTGAGICFIKRMKFSTPSSFIIKTDAFAEIHDHEHPSPLSSYRNLMTACRLSIQDMENECGLDFFNLKEGNNPLLVSLRCGTTKVVPELNYSVLSVGMNESVCKRLAKWSQNEWFSLNTYANFLHSFGVHVMGVPSDSYADVVKDYSDGSIDEFNFSVDVLKKIISKMKSLCHIPEDPWHQFKLAVRAMFDGWPTKCPLDRGLLPAITVQEMVYGNFNNNSGAGILFSRDPISGKSGVHGEYIYQLAGTGVSDGLEITYSADILRRDHPDVFEMLSAIVLLLELEARDVQRTEFVIQDGKFFILGTQTAICSALANVRILSSMVSERLITRVDAILRINPAQMSRSIFLQIDPAMADFYPVYGYGHAVSAGFTSGYLSFASDKSKVTAVQQQLITVYKDFNCFDRLLNSVGIISLRGGSGAHSAMISRKIGIPAILGASRSGIRFYGFDEAIVNAAGVRMMEGDVVTIDGTSGKIYAGKVPGVPIHIDTTYCSIMQWASELKRADVFSVLTPRVGIESRFLRDADGGVYKLASYFVSNDEILDPLRFLLMSKSRVDEIKYAKVLAEALSLHILPLLMESTGKPLLIMLPSFPICTVLSMSDADFFEFSVRNCVSMEEVKSRFDTLIDYKDSKFLEASKFFSFLRDSAFNNQTDCCCELHMCSACQSFLSNQHVIGAILEGTLEAFGLLMQNIPTADCSVRFLVSDSFRDEAIDYISATIDAISIRVPSSRIELGLQVTTPRSCLNLEKMAVRNDITFVLFNSDRLTELAYGVSKCSKIKRCNKRCSTNSLSPSNLLESSPLQVIDPVGVGSLIESAIKRIRYCNPNCRVAVEGEHCRHPDSIYYFCSIDVDIIVISDMASLDCARLTCAQFAVLERKLRDDKLNDFYSKLPV